MSFLTANHCLWAWPFLILLKVFHCRLESSHSVTAYFSSCSLCIIKTCYITLACYGIKLLNRKREKQLQTPYTVYSTQEHDWSKERHVSSVWRGSQRLLKSTHSTWEMTNKSQTSYRVNGPIRWKDNSSSSGNYPITRTSGWSFVNKCDSAGFAWSDYLWR